MAHILLDTSNILYRGFYALKGHPCGEALYLLQAIRSFLKVPDSLVYLCLDGAARGRRIDPAYKANRAHGEISVYRHLPQIVYSLQGLRRVLVRYNPELEADEVIFSLTREVEGEKVIVSTDNDLLQSLRADTSILRKGKVIDEAYYRENMASKFHAVEPCRLPIYRAIAGDTSDNLAPAVPRFPHALAARIAGAVPYDGSCPSKEALESLFCMIGLVTEAQGRKLRELISSYPTFRSNFEIMKLEVHKDLECPYYEENPPLQGFTQGMICMLREIRELSNGTD